MKKLLSLFLIATITISSFVFGSLSATAKTKKTDISNNKDNIILAIDWYQTKEDITTYPYIKAVHYSFYNKKEIKPVTPNISIGRKDSQGNISCVQLKRGKDYTMSKTKKLQPGETKKITVKGKGKYTGKRNFYYGVMPKIKAYIKADSYLKSLPYDAYTIIKCYFIITRGIGNEINIEMHNNCYNGYRDKTISFKRSQCKLLKSGKYKGYYYIKKKVNYCCLDNNANMIDIYASKISPSWNGYKDNHNKNTEEIHYKYESHNI